VRTKLEIALDLALYYCIDLDNVSGGRLHVALADGNLRDSDLQFVLSEAIAANDPVGASLAYLLLAMTEDEREDFQEKHIASFRAKYFGCAE
jgi:hypothetical protein